MTLDQLRYFCATAHYEHVGKAARAIAISPSALSHASSSLEAELGHRLFVRQGKRIFLSAHGRELQARASSLLASAEELREALASDTVALQGHFRLAGTHGLAAALLAP